MLVQYLISLFWRRRETCRNMSIFVNAGPSAIGFHVDTNRTFTSLFSKSHNSIWKHVYTATITKKNFKQIHAKFEQKYKSTYFCA